MFSKTESKQLRQDFWIAFGKSFPTKWTLYNTKIKGLSFKFHFDLKMAMVSMDVETSDLEQRIRLWDKLVSFKSILIDEYLPDAHFDDSYLLEHQKEISRVYVYTEGVSIHNRKTWQASMQFLNGKMALFESFFQEYKDSISS